VLQAKTYKSLSPLELKIITQLLKYKNLKFESNYEVKPYFIDIAFPKHKVGLEIDGRAYHSSEEQRARDELRQEYLEMKGWRIERVAGWFCYRFPEITTAKVLRYVPEVQGHPLYQDALIKTKQWFARDLLNRGYKEQAITVLTDLSK
jgi:very-short-patch-repair endonuclease